MRSNTTLLTKLSVTRSSHKLVFWPERRVYIRPVTPLPCHQSCRPSMQRSGERSSNLCSFAIDILRPHPEHLPGSLAGVRKARHQHRCRCKEPISQARSKSSLHLTGNWPKFKTHFIASLVPRMHPRCPCPSGGLHLRDCNKSLNRGHGRTKYLHRLARAP